MLVNHYQKYNNLLGWIGFAMAVRVIVVGRSGRVVQAQQHEDRGKYIRGGLDRVGNQAVQHLDTKLLPPLDIRHRAAAGPNGIPHDE